MMTDLTDQQFGSYHLVRRLGVGGFASVYLGQHLRISSKQAAIKILHLFDVDVQQFQQEAETTEQLRHPNIVRLLDFDVQEGMPFLVLDYAPGGSLRARHPKGSQIPLATVIGYLKELVPALQYAHDQDILHRDIKPDNILIGQHGELLLSDFGIALLSRTGKTSTQGPTNIGGTPYYMAPEQFRGRPSKASDQYALATVVYEWLSGTVPFSEGDWIQLGFQHLQEPVPPLRVSLPALPATAEQVVLKALSKDPQERFPRVEDFAIALQAATQQDMIPPPITPSPSHYPAPAELHKPIRDHSAESRQIRGDLSSPLVPPPPPPSSTKADQSLAMKTPAIIQSVSSMAASAEVPPSPRLGSTPPPRNNMFTPTARPASLPSFSKRYLALLVTVLLLIAVIGEAMRTT